MTELSLWIRLKYFYKEYFWTIINNLQRLIIMITYNKEPMLIYYAPILWIIFKIYIYLNILTISSIDNT